MRRKFRDSHTRNRFSPHMFCLLDELTLMLQLLLWRVREARESLGKVEKAEGLDPETIYLEYQSLDDFGEYREYLNFRHVQAIPDPFFGTVCVVSRPGMGQNGQELGFRSGI